MFQLTSPVEDVNVVSFGTNRPEKTLREVVKQYEDAENVREYLLVHREVWDAALDDHTLAIKMIDQIVRNDRHDLRRSARSAMVTFGGNLDVSLQVLKPGGTIAAYASQAVPEPKIPFYTLLYQHVVVRHILVLLMPDEKKQQAVAEISRWLEQNALTHHLGLRFPLEQTVAAHEAVENAAVGKVLIEIAMAQD